MRHLAVLILLVSLVLVGCGGTQADATLTGGVTIGPIVPIDMGDGTQIPPETEAYLTRTIVVLDPSGAEAARTEIMIPGRYEFSLQPGSYTVEIELIGIESSEHSPALVAVGSGQPTEHNIFIDTGIR